MQKNQLLFLVKLKLVMAHQINQVKHLRMEVLLVSDEIKLVRKVLDWKHKPFEIPKNILKRMEKNW